MFFKVLNNSGALLGFEILVSEVVRKAKLVQQQNVKIIYVERINKYGMETL